MVGDWRPLPVALASVLREERLRRGEPGAAGDLGQILVDQMAAEVAAALAAENKSLGWADTVSRWMPWVLLLNGGCWLLAMFLGE